MKKTYIGDMLKFIDASVTPFHAVNNIAEALELSGYSELSEKDRWKLWPGMKFYTKRNNSSIIAFSLPNGDFKGFKIFAAHSDSPCFKLKENPEMPEETGLIRLNTERYGGMIVSTWLDRPLSLAGRIVYDSKDGLKEKLFNIDKDLLIIPNVAVHMNSEINKGYEYKLQSDLLPLFATGGSQKTVKKLISKETGIAEEDILGSDVYLYTRQKGTLLGAQKEFAVSPRLDDLSSAYAGLQGFLSTDTGKENYTDDGYVKVFAVFDNEEVGSLTKQGADSSFLQDTLQRVAESLSLSQNTYLGMLADSFLISADNAHAAHPAMLSKADPVNRPKLNGGVVLKFNSEQHYATDGYSAAYLRKLAKKTGVVLQDYSNNSNVRGGSTLGNISTAHVSVATADIGLPQLSMHSAVETMGSNDINDMINLAATFFGA